MTAILFMDTETTGLDPMLATPWEIAWQIYDHQPGIVQTVDAPTAGQVPVGQLVPLSPRRVYQVTLTAEQLADADPIALAIGRYAERRAAVTYPAGYILARLRADITATVGRVAGEGHVTLCGACVYFDETMLARWWGGSVNDRPWHYHHADIENLVAGAVSPPAPPPWSYRDLLARIGVYEDEATKHTASGDVDAVIAAYATVYRLRVLS